MQKEEHYGNRSNWLRAAVLGANDGLLSVASIVIGVAAAQTTKENILLAGIAGLVAGAFSMAAGEYVSVSSQKDLENADLKREQEELDTMPEVELQELANIYESRGLSKETALEVARQMTTHNALEAHVRDELGINEITQARPLQAAMSSGLAFVLGGILPVVTSFFSPQTYLQVILYSSTIAFLALLGTIAAKTGGSSIKKAVVRITIWGTLAMGMSVLIGHLFGTQIA